MVADFEMQFPRSYDDALVFSLDELWGSEHPAEAALGRATVDPTYGWSIIGPKAVHGSLILDNAGELGRGELRFLRMGMLQSSEQVVRCSGRFPEQRKNQLQRRIYSWSNQLAA